MSSEFCVGVTKRGILRICDLEVLLLLLVVVVIVVVVIVVIIVVVVLLLLLLSTNVFLGTLKRRLIKRDGARGLQGSVSSVIIIIILICKLVSISKSK